MNKASLKILVFLSTVLFICFLCSGCTQSNSNILGGNLSTVSFEDHNKALRCKNGVIVVKSDEQSNMNHKTGNTLESSVGEVKFGPKNINFDL